MKKMIGALGLALAMAPLATPAAQAATTTTTTVYAQSIQRTQYLFATNVGGQPSVGYVTGGTALTGTVYPNGWFKITAGPYAGKWVWQPSSTPTMKPAANVTRYAATAVTSPYYANPQAVAWKTTVKPLTTVVGDYYPNGWFQERKTGYWLKNTLAGHRYNTYEVRQWQNTTGFRAMATPDQTVTRYVHLNNTKVPVHSVMSYGTSTIAGRLASSTAIKGHYVNSHWFQITSGPMAGKYVSSGLTYTQQSAAVMNGKMKSEDLCTVPNSMRTEFTVHDLYLGCEALNQATFLDSALRAQGLSFRQWDSYRDYATQVQYKKLYGSIAANPGTSNHGFANAVDLRYDVSSKGRLLWTSPIVKAMLSVGPNFGWTKPAALMPTGYNPEPWHFDFSG